MFNLTNDELLVLFEWSHRCCETGQLAFSHHAEAVVIDRLASELEQALKEPVDAAYPQLLNESRERVLSAYEQRMGHQTWIHNQPLKQT